MREKVIAVFDIGKTNKKLLLFDGELKVIYSEESRFKTILDEDGDECDDIALIEEWIINRITTIITDNTYDVVGVNFSTYGASIVFIDADNKRITPLYNYLKRIPEEIQETLFNNYGGAREFCRKTASPELGFLLNSGIQVLWLKQRKKELFSRVNGILHFPQYLSFMLTGEMISEATSVGCHTFLWDFDNMTYHNWLSDQGITLPTPIENFNTIPVEIEGHKLNVGIGIHDSSSSLVPFLRSGRKHFLLISTGTWCINMNPFNHQPLTIDQLDNDCLCFLSNKMKPVKSSRLFMGYIHDVNSKLLSDFFNVPDDFYRQVILRQDLLCRYLDGGRATIFFKNGMPSDYIDRSVDLSQFSDYSEAYHRLVYDITMLNCNAIDLILVPEDSVRVFYVSGGFAGNEIFVSLLANVYPDMEIYTTEIENCSALGAALVIRDLFDRNDSPEINLELRRWEAFKKN